MSSRRGPTCVAQSLAGLPWVLAAMLLAAAAVRAQAPSGNLMPEALKGIKPAGGICPREEHGRGDAAGAALADAVPPDWSCGLAPSQLPALSKQVETTLIDVRTPKQHDAFRITGSLNMTVSELRTKPILRGKTVVLIGNGKAERELHAACAALRAQGFRQVKVLRGGMPAWVSSGGAIDGIAPDAQEMARLSSAELWAESQSEANLVLVSPHQQGMLQHVPFAVPLTEESAAAVKAVIERRRRELKNAPLASVILVTASTSPADRWLRLRESLQPVPLLVYAETMQTYARQIAQQKAAWVAHARGPKQPACGS